MAQPSPYRDHDLTLVPEADLRRLARLIAEELEALSRFEPVLLSAADIAREYGLTRGWVYKHARELGGQRMGSGPKARLRFRAAEVRQRLSDLQAAQPAFRDAPRGAARDHTDLLPIGGGRRARARPQRI
jgi:hypothetical protein